MSNSDGGTHGANQHRTATLDWPRHTRDGQGATVALQQLR